MKQGDNSLLNCYTTLAPKNFKKLYIFVPYFSLFYQRTMSLLATDSSPQTCSLFNLFCLSKPIPLHKRLMTATNLLGHIELPGYIVPTQTKNGKVFIQYETSTRTKANKYIRINNKAAKEVSLHLSPNQKTHVPRPDKFGKLNKKSLFERTRHSKELLSF